MTEIVSSIPPIAVVLVCAVLFLENGDLVSAFLEGGKQGARVSFALLPTLVLLVVGTTSFTSSGTADAISSLFAPVASKIGIPSDALPLIVTRPFSGSGSLALTASLFEKVGPDSGAGLFASVLVGSGETVFYVLSVYLAGASVRRSRRALFIALFVSVLSIFLSVIACRIFFPFAA